MHQCDYCCWYYSEARGCECPSAMKESACEKARKEKDAVENKTAPVHNKRTVEEPIKLEQNVSTSETTCSKCKHHYKGSVTRETNAAGMWMEYTFCPKCQQKNLVAWHVW